MDNYKVAIIIPCWNSSMFIRQMLDSVICQTYSDFRVFCVDDESEDDTISILQEYAQKDHRINVVKRNRLPKGAPTCRNIGFDCSDGAEYVIWFDSDDVIAPYCIAQRVLFMDHHPELDYGCFKAKTFKSDPSEREGTSLYGIEYPFADDMTRMIKRRNPFGGWELIHRRSSLLKSQIIWDEQLLSYQDTDFIIQLFQKGLKYQYANDTKIDYFYRTGYRPFSITLNRFTDADKASDLYFLNKLYHHLTDSQKKRYSLDLDGYVLYFFTVFYQDSAFVDQLLQLDWIKNRKWLTFRIKLCSKLLSFMNRKMRHLLFPLTYIYGRFEGIKYRNYQKEQLLLEIERGFASC